MTVHSIIVDAGFGGCVLAARMSWEPSHTVMLFEAGPDYSSDAELPSGVCTGFNPTSTHDCGYVCEPGFGIPPIARKARGWMFYDECSVCTARFAGRL